MTQDSPSPLHIQQSITPQVWPSVQDQQDGGDVEGRLGVQQGRYATSTLNSLRGEPGVDFVSIE